MSDDVPLNPNVNPVQHWYHGTDLRGAAGILENGPRTSRTEGNLGRGFYVTDNPGFASRFGRFVFGGTLPANLNIAWHDSHGDYINEAWNEAEDTGEPEEPGFDIHGHYHQALADSTDAEAVGSRETNEVNLFDPKDFSFNHLIEYDEKDPRGTPPAITRLDE